MSCHAMAILLIFGGCNVQPYVESPMCWFVWRHVQIPLWPSWPEKSLHAVNYQTICLYILQPAIPLRLNLWYLLYMENRWFTVTKSVMICAAVCILYLMWIYMYILACNYILEIFTNDFCQLFKHFVSLSELYSVSVHLVTESLGCMALWKADVVNRPLHIVQFFRKKS